MSDQVVRGPRRRRGRGRKPAATGAPAAVYEPLPLPSINFPPELPVSGHAEQIAQAIKDHPVVIVCGETGSGKTTQLPKICALAGRGQAGRIGHTQPRRIAASSVARRIAQELNSPLGELVGYQVRFGQQLSAGSRFKLMTDGILLAETQNDRHLRQYDTIIVDEAHERSLNIDFLLGYLKRLVDGPRRDDLRLVITSATIDAQRFAEHFGQAGKPAPVIEVSGRLYPVDVRYAPSQADGAGDDEGDLPSQIETAISQLWRQARGDVLVFLPGERQIREAAEHLRRAVQAQRLGRSEVEIIPLFARLSAAEQQRVFSPGNALRIVLATNVAETSLTVPGIRYVVDSGLARVKRYRLRGKVEQLQIEPVSQAAANQRAGRCGRVSDGVCIRLYDQAQFDERPRFTDPEVLRSSLASVILRMTDLRLGDVDQFPFIDPPPTRAVNDGYALLTELGAVDEQRRLTGVGRQLARLPVDPRLGRMLLAGHQSGCLQELLVIASALSTQDPRDRPMDAQQAADAAHQAFEDKSSDFLGLLRIWQFWQSAQQSRSEGKETRSAMNRRVQRSFLSIRRLREWTDVHQQLAQAVKELKWKLNDESAKPDVIHRALLTGLLGNLGFKPPDEPQYLGTHQTRFLVHPASSLTRRQPRWIMAAEMVDTARLFARTVAAVQPAWIESAAGHLLRKSWSEAFWSAKRGQAMRYESGVLYGLTVYGQRRVGLGADQASLAREMFIQHALVLDEWFEKTARDRSRPGKKPPAFVGHNRQMVAQVHKMEEKIRRPDLLVDEQFLFDWFDARVPDHVTDARSFDKWFRVQVKTEPNLLRLSRDELLRKDAEGVSSQDFPKTLAMRGVDFSLDYRFEPGESDDGVTVTVPLSLLNQVDSDRCEWLVPGLLKDKVAALAKSLPQRMRRHLVPLPAYAQAFYDRHHARLQDSQSSPLIDAIRDDAREHHAVTTQYNDYRPEVLPSHLHMNFRLLDVHGGQLAMSRNLAQLRSQYGQQAAGAFREAFANVSDQLRTRPAAPAQSADKSVKPDQSTSSASKTDKVDRKSSSGSGTQEQGSDLVSVDGARIELTVGQTSARWPVDALPELLEIHEPATGTALVGFPAFVDRGTAVSIEVFDEESRARTMHRLGVRRLLANQLRQPIKALFKNIDDMQGLTIAYARLGTDEDLRAGMTDAILQRAIGANADITTRDQFVETIEQVRPRLSLIGQELARTLSVILQEYATATRKIQLVGATAREDEVREAVSDTRAQLDALIFNGFISQTPADYFAHLARYLKAIVIRLERVRADPGRDTDKRTDLADLHRAWVRLVRDRKGIHDPELEKFRWLIEELRVSLFAQSLRTPTPVSFKRLNKMLNGLRAGS